MVTVVSAVQYQFAGNCQKRRILAPDDSRGVPRRGAVFGRRGPARRAQMARGRQRKAAPVSRSESTPAGERGTCGVQEGDSVAYASRSANRVIPRSGVGNRDRAKEPPRAAEGERADARFPDQLPDYQITRLPD